MLQLPTRYTEPLSEDFKSDGDKLIQVVETFMTMQETGDVPIKLDEWQKWLLRHMLERYPEDHENPNLAGRLRYRQVVVSMGRQNGKSTLTQALSLYALLMHEQGPTVVGVASSVEQARIVYNRTLYSVNNNPWLKKRFAKATEHRGMHLVNGAGTYMIRAAKETALQGIAVSFGIVDELHILPEGLYSALTLGTSTKKDGMVVGITTAGDESSTTLMQLYDNGQKAIDGDPDFERFGFFCWEAPEGCELDDPQAIYAANPAVAAGRIPLETIVSDLKSIPELEARRYRLNQFIEKSSIPGWLPMDLFNNAEGQGITEKTNPLVFALDRTSSWGNVTISAARKCPDGTYETELVRSYVNPTEDQLFADLKDLYLKYMPMGIGLDDRQMPNIGKKLKLSGIPTYQLWAKEVTAACSFAYWLFANDKVKHNNDPLLRDQTARGIPKYSGESWYISRKESKGDLDALMSTIFALYVATIVDEPTLQVF
jgi:phage terminase large subunit-like protein